MLIKQPERWDGIHKAPWKLYAVPQRNIWEEQEALQAVFLNALESSITPSPTAVMESTLKTILVIVVVQVLLLLEVKAICGREHGFDFLNNARKCFCYVDLENFP